MPLSEQEQRLLDEMERHLLKNDADVVSAPSAGSSLSYRNMVYGVLLLIFGLIGLIAGVAVGGIAGIIVGVVAFVAMLVGVLLALTPVHRVGVDAPAGKATASAQAGSSFMDRMNDRWDRRQDGR